MSTLNRSDVVYGSTGMRFESVFVRPDVPEPLPGLIVLHGLFGLQEMDIRFVERLAEHGYAVLLHGWQTTDRDPADDIVGRGVGMAVRWLAGQPGVADEPFGLIGVCRGGSLAVISAAALQCFSRVVSFYGQAHYAGKSTLAKPVSPITLVDRISAPLLAIHGERDTTFPASDSRDFCERLLAKGGSCELITHPDAEHGFFLEGHRNYHPDAAEEIWPRLLSFLERNRRKADEQGPP